MQKFASVLLSTILAYLINQLPAINKQSLPDPYILAITGGCLLLTMLLPESSQTQAATLNLGSLSSWTSLLVGAFLAFLLWLKVIPEQLQAIVFSFSLLLVILGALLPTLILALKNRQQFPFLRFLYFFVLGLGLFLAGYFFQKTEWLGAFFCLILTAFVGFSPLLSKFLDLFERKLADRIMPIINELLNNLAENLVIRFFLLLTSPLQKKYYQSLIFTYRNYRTEGLKTKGPFTLDLEKVFVTLRIAPESVDRTSSEMIRTQNSSKSLNIWDCLAASRNQPQFCQIVIIGAPGSGKTTLLEHLTLTYAKNSQRRQNRQAPKLVPILLYLRDVRDKISSSQSQPSLPQLIEEQLNSKNKLQLPPQWIEKKLHHQACLVMLDGLDEVADENQRQAVSKWVNQQIEDYPNARFLLTSRPYGYKNAPVENIKVVLEVQRFNFAEVREFIHNWYLQGEIASHLGKNDQGVRETAQKKSDDLIHRIQHSSPLAAMAVNPLLLTMIATVHCYRGALPGRRVELYGEICDVLLVRRQEAKGITNPLPLASDKKKSVLQVLALELMKLKTREFTPTLASNLIRNHLAKVVNTSLTPEVFLEKIQHESGLLIEREKGVYEFAHKSFQEYLAAVEVQKSNHESFLIAKINEDWWEETIRLYAAQNEATNLIRAALDHPSLVSLKLVADGLEEGWEIEPKVRGQLLQRLEDGLESAEREIAHLAAEVKLARRLSNLLRVDETLAITQDYITCAEYQLFIDEKVSSSQHFQPGTAKQPITGLCLEDVLEFCSWLNEKARSWNGSTEILSAYEGGERISYYRLPTAMESQSYGATATPKLGNWSVGDSNPEEKGIRIVKAKILAQYGKLEGYLASGDWQRADRETTILLRDLSDSLSLENLCDSDLYLLDYLWLQASKGRFGWGVQTRIWEASGGNLEDFGKLAGWWDVQQKRWYSSDEINFQPDDALGYLPRLWWLNSPVQKAEVWQSLTQRFMASGIERSPIQVFEGMLVNNRGQEIKRKWHHAKYFTEELGNDITLEMVAIPGGELMMGTEDEEIERLAKKFNWEYFSQEKPQHQVTLPSFYMGKYPITQAQWQAIASRTDLKVELNLDRNPSLLRGDNRPVERVNWYDAIEFCGRLSKLTGREYRLPSEAEWEYACRAGTTTAFHFGETITGDLANYNATKTYADEPKGEYREETTPVGQFPPNAFGLYDMHGNVWEWCADDWHDNYDGAPTDGSVWIENGNDNCSPLRGGSWYLNPYYCRSAYRFYNYRRAYDNTVSFRVVCGAGRTL
jgi:formylglycine-generating enzyme required for sulfatase activity/energy-coupling factor transporter ATP-binding protein EcfA2